MENPLTRIIRGGRKPERQLADGQKSDRLTPDGLRITEFPAPITRILRLYGLAGSYAQLYAAQPNVRTIVDDLSNEAAELTMKMYMKDPRGELLADARIEVGHPMMDLLDEPQPLMSPFRFWKALFSDIGIYDIAHWRMVGGLPPKALVRIPPGAIAPQYDARTGLVNEWMAMATGERISPDELITFWGYDPSVNHGSIPPLETLRRILAEDFASSEDREARWSNSLRKDGVIEQDVQATRMSDEARESFLTDAEEALSGAANSYTPFLMEPGMRWRDTEWSPKEMEYLGARRLNRTECAAVFHYPAAKVLAQQSGVDPDKNTLDYFYTSTLPPYLSRVEAEVQAQLLPKFEMIKKTRKAFYVEFNLDAKLRGSFESQAQIMATTAGGPVVTVNEARARLNLPPIQGGDQIFVPLNSMRGGGPQVSPESPTDTPAQGLNPVGTTPTPLPEGGRAPAALPSGTASITPEVRLVPVKYIEEVLSPDANGETIEAILAQHDRKMAWHKAADDHVTFMRETRARFEERHAQVFAKHFDRQKNALKGGKSDLASPRWNAELSKDLYGVSLQTVEHVGKHTADSIGGAWSTERTDNYLHVSADGNAQAINEGSQSILASELQKHGVEKLADIIKPGSGEAVGTLEDIWTALFSSDRVKELAASRTTGSMNWGASEAAHQNEDVFKLNKTWFTTSMNPRKSHAELDGSTVPYDDVFANGLRFPGDGAAGNADEVAGCTCVMSVSQVQ